MRIRQCLPLCALATLMFGSVVGCESGQLLNRGDGPSSDHYLFSVEDPIPGDAWNTRGDDEKHSYCL